MSIRKKIILLLDETRTHAMSCFYLPQCRVSVTLSSR